MPVRNRVCRASDVHCRLSGDRTHVSSVSAGGRQHREEKENALDRPRFFGVAKSRGGGGGSLTGAIAAKADAEAREGGGEGGEVKVAATLSAGVDGSRVLTRRNSVGGGCTHVSLATKPPQPSPKKSKAAAAAAVDPAQTRAALEAAAQLAEV